VRKKRENRKWNVENKEKPKPFVTTSIGTAFTREDKMTAGPKAMVQGRISTGRVEKWHFWLALGKYGT
jgi:hypothetical protein